MNEEILFRYFDQLVCALNEANRPSVFRQPDIHGFIDEQGRTVFGMEDASIGIEGRGFTPADAATAFDRAWYSGKTETYPVPKEATPVNEST